MPVWLIVLLTAIGTYVLIIIVRQFIAPEKSIRHEIEHLYGVEDEQFLRTVGALLPPNILQGNRITPLINGDQIFPAMLDAIRAARHTITFESLVSSALVREGEQPVVETPVAWPVSKPAAARTARGAHLKLVVSQTQPLPATDQSMFHGNNALAALLEARPPREQEVHEETYHVMRILRKETDGEWRVYRTIWAPGG